jgi:hypothetical protein
MDTNVVATVVSVFFMLLQCCAVSGRFLESRLEGSMYEMMLSHFLRLCTSDSDCASVFFFEYQSRKERVALLDA